MGVEIVLHQDNLSRLCKVRVGEILEDTGIVDGGVAIGHLNMAPTLQRGKQHEQIGRAIPLVLIVVASRVPWFRRDRHARFSDELLEVSSRQTPDRKRTRLNY